MPWALSFLLIWLNKLSNPFSYFRTKSIYRFPHQNKRNNNSYKTSCDDICRPMNCRSHSSKRSYQWKHNQDSSKSEEFFVFVFYTSKQRYHSDTHRNCSMIRRKTRTWQKFVQNSFLFEISQSQHNIWSWFINKKLNSDISYHAESHSCSDIHRRHFIIQPTFERFNIWTFHRLNNSKSIQYN